MLRIPWLIILIFTFLKNFIICSFISRFYFYSPNQQTCTTELIGSSLSRSRSYQLAGPPGLSGGPGNFIREPQSVQFVFNLADQFPHKGTLCLGWFWDGGVFLVLNLEASVEGVILV